MAEGGRPAPSRSKRIWYHGSMPTVRLSQQAFDRVRQLATQQRTTPDQVVERSVEEYLLSRERTPEDRKREWGEWYEAISARAPAGLTEDEVLDDLESAAREARAERLARGH